MKLAVFVDQVFWFDGECYSTDAAFVKFVTAFESCFEKIVFCGRLSGERRREKYILDPIKTEVCALPFYENLYALGKVGLSVIPETFRILARESETWDLVWLCVPNPLALLYVYLCKRKQIPFFMMVRGNLVRDVRYRSRGLTGIAARAAAGFLQNRFQALARRHITFAIGEEMYRQYKKADTSPVFRGICSLISERDVELSRVLRGTIDPKPRKPVLLSVLRLEPEKGGQYLIEAVRLLVEDKRLEFELHLVGSGRMENALRSQVSRMGLEAYIHFHGYVPFGAELLALYRSASAFILPSLTEGVPQVLIEAMACGVPVIATKVGGVPQLLKDEVNGLLVEPAQPAQICHAVFRLLDDEPLRRRLVENGFQTSFKHTLENERNRILTVLKQFGLLRPAQAEP